MFTAIITLILVASALLVLVVLAQNPKGGGLSSQFGGSGASQLMGVKKTGDFLEKATWTLAIGVLLLTMLSTIYAPTSGDRLTTPNIESAGQGGTPAFEGGDSGQETEGDSTGN